MRQRGVGRERSSRRRAATPSGQELRWQAHASLGAGNPLPIFFVQHLTPLAALAAAGGAARRSSERRATRSIASTSRWPMSAVAQRSYGARARHARAEDPARRGHQGRHGGLRSRADGPDRWRSRPSRAPPPGASPGAGAPSRCCTARVGWTPPRADGRSRPAAARARRPQHGRACDAVAARAGVRAPTSASWCRRGDVSGSGERLRPPESIQRRLCHERVPRAPADLVVCATSPVAPAVDRVRGRPGL